MSTVADWIAECVRLLSSNQPAGEDAVLADFQVAAVRRLVSIAQRFGGALHADGVGLGKTRVCLSAAATLGKQARLTGGTGTIWCIVPARTKHQWRATAALVGVREDCLELVTHAAMSRGRLPKRQPDVVVVDEAHHFRNRNTRRRAALEALDGVPLLLATATPVVNDADDLLSLLELFVDDADARAVTGYDLRTTFSCADPTLLLRELLVRRTEAPSPSGFGRRPRSRLAVVDYDPPPEEAWLWQHLEPSISELSLAAFGGDWPRGLFVEHVLRRWESGPEALDETLSDIVTYHHRWLDAARGGRRLDRSEFREVFGVNADQLVFDFVFRREGAAPTEAEMTAVSRDRSTVEQLRLRVQAVLSAGTGRDRVVTALAREPEKLLVFTSYRRAARGLFDRLCTELGPRATVGLLTGTEARATGLGSTAADEVLQRFSPGAFGRTLRDHESLQVLVATDCIAEGVNLQDCGRVVLADLPYTPVGVEQRVGRLVRPGGPHSEVIVFLPRPRNWNDSLGMRRRLHEKLCSADEVAAQPGGVLSVPSAHATNPYATLAAVDQLASTLPKGERVPRVARVEGPPGSEWWVVARITSDGHSWHWFFAINADVAKSLTDVLPALTDRGWDRSPLAMVEELPSVVSRHLEEHRIFLEAARLAPTPLELDAPQVRAWRVLCENPHGLDLDDLRARLLRRHSAAVHRSLERLLATQRPKRLARYVKKLPARGLDPVSAEVVMCLGF